MKRTKIVCTLGPACNDVAVLSKMIRSGMDVARINLSHGNYDQIASILDELRDARAKTGKEVPVMFDTQGPEIRTGEVDQPLSLEEGDSTTLVCDSEKFNTNKCTEDTVYVSYEGLPSDVSVGEEIILDDGKLQLRITDVQGDRVTTRVTTGGTLRSRRSVNVPTAAISLPILTDKDKEDVRFAEEQDADFLALSFVRTAENVRDARDFVDQIPLIAKIEDKQGVDNAEDIINTADGIMVARGDLGVEISVQRVPGVQKRLVRSAITKQRPVVTATEMLDSMQNSPTPTRAEVTDVYRAVEEGSGAVMLSAETAVGDHPVASVESMRDIITTAEEECDFSWVRDAVRVRNSVTTSICEGAVTASERVNAAAMVAFTESGHTARSVSAFRPPTPIVASSPNQRTRRQLHLYWGVVPVTAKDVSSLEELLGTTTSHTEETGLSEEGDTIVSVAGTPVGQRGSTNTVRIMTVGNVIVRGYPLRSGRATGPVVFCRSTQEARQVAGAVAVVFTTRQELFDALDDPAAVLVASTHVSDDVVSGLDCPVITEVLSVEQRISPGDKVRVFGDKGVVLSAE